MKWLRGFAAKKTPKRYRKPAVDIEPVGLAVEQVLEPKSILRQCINANGERKRPFLSRELAEVSAAVYGCVVYKCQLCGHFHYGHKGS